MCINSVGYSPNISYNANKPAFKALAQAPETSEKPKENIKKASFLEKVGFALLVTGLSVMAVLHIMHVNNLKNFVKTLNETAGKKIKDGLKKYPYGTRSRILEQLQKDGKIKQAAPEKIDELIKNTAKNKDIKSLEEESFTDKLTRFVDALLIF